MCYCLCTDLCVNEVCDGCVIVCVQTCVLINYDGCVNTEVLIKAMMGVLLSVYKLVC